MSVFDRIRDSFKFVDKNALNRIIIKTERIFRFATMPAASAEYVTNLVQYIGTSNVNYTNGFFYRSILNGTDYEWRQVNIQPNDDIPHWSGTKAQYNADPSAVPVGTYITFIDDADTNYESGIYSTDEVRTGKKWLNGKPIYRKCFYAANISAAGPVLFGSITQDLEDITLSTGTWNDGAASPMVIPMGVEYNSVSASPRVDIANGNLFLDKTAGTLTRVNVTLEYTKSTD